MQHALSLPNTGRLLCSPATYLGLKLAATRLLGIVQAVDLYTQNRASGRWQHMRSD